MRLRFALAVLAGALALPVSASSAPAGPALEVPAAQLSEALRCPDAFDDAARQPVLLVHGTFTNDWEHWSWNWERSLRGQGWDVCTVTLPGRSLGDMQTQAEYVVHAIREIAARSGERVDVMGHSQGGLHPRWAVRWWPDVEASVDDLIMLATPNHGTDLSAVDSPLGCFAACWQMTPRSHYLTALNAGDETPGSVSYTSIYTATDELVQPQVPESTSALDGGANFLLQEVCPGRSSDHALIMIDHVVYTLAMDALVEPGPADPDRLDPVALCLGATMPGADPASHAADIMRRSMAEGMPPMESTDSEPPLRPYAQGGSPAPSTGAGGDGAPGGAAVLGASESGGVTPATGGASWGYLPAAGLVLAGLRRRQRPNPAA